MFSKSATDRRARIWWSIAGSAVFFAVLWALDFPKPMTDDLFYCGAGLHLASGGDLSNPLLIRQHFPSHFFFVYPPLHSYALAGWTDVMGISAASLLAFQAVCYLVIASSAIAVLRHHDAPAVVKWLVPLGVTAALLSVGLRPEPFAIALTTAGFAMAECSPRRGLPVMLMAFLLMCLGASAAPRIAPFALALALCNATDRRGLREGGTTGRQVCAVGVIALSITVLVFAIMIGFRFAEFRETFHLHASRVADGRMRLLLVFMKDIIGIRQWPLLALALALVLVAIAQPVNGLTRAVFFIAATFPVTAMIGGLGHGSIWFAALTVFFSGAAVLKGVASPLKSVLPWLMASVLLFANVDSLVSVAGLLTGKIRLARGSAQSELLAVRSTADHPVLIDSWSARYLFDYKLADGFIDFGFAAAFPRTLVTGSPLNEGDIFLIGPDSVDILNERTGLNHPVEKWVPFGMHRWARARYPREVVLIKAIDCHGLKDPPAPVESRVK